MVGDGLHCVRAMASYINEYGEEFSVEFLLGVFEGVDPGRGEVHFAIGDQDNVTLATAVLSNVFEGAVEGGFEVCTAAGKIVREGHEFVERNVWWAKTLARAIEEVEGACFAGVA